MSYAAPTTSYAAPMTTMAAPVPTYQQPMTMLLQEARLPALQHNQRPLQGVHRVHELALRRRESSFLLVPELRRPRQVRLRAGDLARELLYLRAELADAGRGVRDLRLEVADR